MIINSTLVFCLIPELEEAFRGHKIIQIFQSPDRKELILVTRSRKKETSLFYSSHAENYRIEILDEIEWKTKKANYEKTNLFSYAISGHIQEVKQVDFDRVIKISCLKKSQLGKDVEFDLIFELTGRNSNLILVRKDGLIIDCLRKVDLTKNRFRQVLPGKRYVAPPPPLAGENPSQIEREKFLKLLETHDLSLSELLTSHFIGLDQLLAEKIIFETNIPLQVKTKDLSEENIQYLWKNFSQVFQEISEHKLAFQIVTDEKGKPEGISCVNLPFLKDDQKIFCESLNSAIKEFFSRKLGEQQKKTDLKGLSEATRRAQKKLERRKEKIEEDLDQAEKFEQYKKFGDLLMMDKNSIKKGQVSVKLVDIFDPQQSLVEIPLSVRLSPIQNAQAYFKKYKKAKDALVVMKKRKVQTKKQIVQLEKISEKLIQMQEISLHTPHPIPLPQGERGLHKFPPPLTLRPETQCRRMGGGEGEGEYVNSFNSFAIDRSTEELELEKIKKELTTLGFLKERKIPERRKGIKKEFSPRRFVTKDGCEILVGRNNRENDYLSFKFARPDDLWFHAQDVPGSHVVLRRKEKKREPSHSDIKEAAQVAAYFSKARGAKLEIPPKAGKVPVIYTLAKYVKKPKKGKLGLALVEKEKTILVGPKLIDKMEDNN